MIVPTKVCLILEVWQYFRSLWAHTPNLVSSKNACDSYLKCNDPNRSLFYAWQVSCCDGTNLWPEWIIRFTITTSALIRHFLLRVRGPHHLNFQGPQAKFEEFLHWNTLPILQFFGFHWALRQNFTRAPLDFQGPGSLTSWPPRALSTMVIFTRFQLWAHKLFETQVPDTMDINHTPETEII